MEHIFKFKNNWVLNFLASRLMIDVCVYVCAHVCLKQLTLKINWFGNILFMLEVIPKTKKQRKLAIITFNRIILIRFIKKIITRKRNIFHIIIFSLKRGSKLILSLWLKVMNQNVSLFFSSLILSEAPDFPIGENPNCFLNLLFPSFLWQYFSHDPFSTSLVLFFLSSSSSDFSRKLNILQVNIVTR